MTAQATPPAVSLQRPVFIAGRLAEVRSEGAFGVSARVRELRAAGRDIADLSIGEPAFSPPAHVADAAVSALALGARYTPPAGLPELRDAIAASLRQRGVPRRAGDIIVTPGAKTALLYSFLALVEPGSEVLVPDPGFPAYASLAHLAGAKPVPYRDLEGIEAALTRRTRVLVLNLPGNPRGEAASPGDLEHLASLVLRHGLSVISDEIYARLWFGDEPAAPSIAQVPGLGQRTVVVDGFSKTWAMTGWRLGFVAAPAALGSAFERLAVNGHSCAPDFVQRAGLAALHGGDESVRAMVAELRRRRDLLVAGLNRIPAVRCSLPAGAFYAFPDLSPVLAAAGLDATAFARHLLDDWGLAAVPGTAFGAAGEGHLRLSFAGAADDLPRALERLAGCLDNLTSRAGIPA